MNLELFSCSGGMAEGFRRAGVRFDLAFDADPDACESYETNLGHRPVQMDVRDLLRMVRAGWSPGPVDLVVADPPCTPWSRAGKRQGTDDERDMLGETVELLELLRPVAWMIANVPGLDDADHWRRVVQPVIGGFATRCGYCVDYAALDAADFGVPQHRRRPFWFGHTAGDCIRWPEPTHGDWSTRRLDGRKPWVTCREALGHLSQKDLGQQVRLRKRSCNGKQHGSVGEKPARVVGTSNLSDGNVLLVERQRGDGSSREHAPDRPARTIRASRSNSERMLLASSRHPPSELDAPAKTVPASQPSNGGAVLLTHPRHPINKPDAPSHTICATDRGGAQGALAVEWPWDRPATTVQADCRLGAPGHKDETWKASDGTRARSSPEAVKLSEKAAAILQGFPESWHFAGRTKRTRWSQIGQAMPPPLADAVARSVKQWFDAPTKPQRQEADHANGTGNAGGQPGSDPQEPASYNPYEWCQEDGCSSKAIDGSTRCEAHRHLDDPQQWVEDIVRELRGTNGSKDGPAVGPASPSPSTNGQAKSASGGTGQTSAAVRGADEDE